MISENVTPISVFFSVCGAINPGLADRFSFRRHHVAPDDPLRRVCFQFSVVSRVQEKIESQGETLDTGRSSTIAINCSVLMLLPFDGSFMGKVMRRPIPSAAGWSTAQSSLVFLAVGVVLFPLLHLSHFGPSV